MGNTTSILITSNDNEDYQCILGSLNRQNGLKIIGVENDETSAIIKSERLKPDILILDLFKPAIDGAQLAPIILRRSPNTAIIMICDKIDNDYAERAIKAGVLGYLLRNEDMNKILPVVKIVSMGEYYISASITINAINTIALASKFSEKSLKNSEKRPVFSSTERNIIKCIANGLSDKEIAHYLRLSKGTVRNYISVIKHKTKMKNRVQTVIFSLVHGLINLEQIGFL